MSRIKIMPDKLDTAIPKHVPRSPELNEQVPRFKPGGKYDLPLERSFNRQDGVGTGEKRSGKGQQL